MNVQVTQENLSRALNNVAKVASSRNTLPILANVLIKTVGKRVCVSATNLNIAITCYVGSKVNKEGAITVPARLMQDFVQNLPGGVINLELEDTKLHISTDKHNSTINGIPADEYPVMPHIKSGTNWSINPKQLKSALNQVVAAASNDDARPILTGVNFHTSNGRLVIVATDGYRLAETKTINMKNDINLTVPATAIQDLLRVINDEDEVVVTNNDQQLIFKAGDIELTTRLIEGSYPDYKKLIPKTLATTAQIDRSEFASITKISSLFARESAGSVVLGVDDKKNQVVISSIASQFGENTATADAKVKGIGNITLNSRYINDALSSIDATEVFIGFNGKLDPVILKNSENEDYTHVIMPLKS
ncbi:DNA polymerase III subunit beta [Candidatus Saccharibacteria bacterium]|nr:DNA polymerase III subunit beta [Candidatus Saccharibacteria bacterium]